MARIGFIGLGRMGSGMAARLLAAGHDVAVYNRNPAKTAALHDNGAHVYHTARDAAAGAHAVIAMTADDDSSRAVWLGESGVLAAILAPGALAIECSTLSYDWVNELAAEVHKRGSDTSTRQSQVWRATPPRVPSPCSLARMNRISSARGRSSRRSQTASCGSARSAAARRTN
jgi:hypothetical protein